jgi:lipoyl(octanoyl) transferase
MACVFPALSDAAVALRRSAGTVDYPDALSFMGARAAAIRAGAAPETLWFLEHPPLYTAGTSAKKHDLLRADFPVYEAGRGGQYTYHGPGQRVAYVMLDLLKRKSGEGPDLKAYICALEDWIIRALGDLGVRGERRAGRIGIWVDRGGAEKKIAAVGVRVRRWVTLHGISINLNPDLSHFSGIVPCGISEHGVTSLADLGIKASMADLDTALKRHFTAVFGAELTPE